MSQEGFEGVLVIGAGPAGLMAADSLARVGFAVMVCDATPSPARKFLMAGLSGLNITHSEPLSKFLTRYRPGHPALLRAIEKFPPAFVRDFCAELGQDTFVGPSGRVFPRAMKAAPLLRAWLNRLGAMGVVFRSRWTFIDRRENCFIFTTPDGERSLRPQACVMALGGASWPRLGATGDWKSVLERQNFKIAPFAPSNCGLRMAWPNDFLDRFEGAPIKNICARAGALSAQGDIVVTRRGLEGGPIYALSHELRRLAAQGRPIVTLDLKPMLPQSCLEARLSQGRKGDSLANILRKRNLSAVHAALLRLSQGGPVLRSPQALAARIKNTEIQFVGFDDLERAISTAGGLMFEQLDANLMAQNAPGLFFAGEMLDWDAPTGGYLLQACLASGALAGEGAAAWLGGAKTMAPAMAVKRK